jgi:acetylornithine deacetylase/succinyl-diaminopimelate desuccinylase-like protein
VRDGWLYGRGTTDNKDEAAAWTAALSASSAKDTCRIET